MRRIFRRYFVFIVKLSLDGSFMNFATIAAISTPPGKGGVALLRVSGVDAFNVASKVFRPLSGKKIESLPARYQSNA